MRKQAAQGRQHGISQESLGKLAKVLRCSRHWLLTGEGQEQDLAITPFGMAYGSERTGTLPVAGPVAAGNWSDVTDLSHDPNPIPSDIPPDPRYPLDRQYAVLVRGTSINNVAREGDYLVVADLGTARSGDLVIAVCDRDGMREVSARRYYENGSAIELRPDSSDPRYNDPKHPDYLRPIRFDTGSAKENDIKVEIRAVVVAVHRVL
jgi:SOS-response transcriptional repressor LexA